MATLSELEEMARLARMKSDKTIEIKAEQDRQEAERLKEFQDTLFGTKKRQKWAQMQEAWEEHKRQIDSNPANFNYFRVTFPTSIWATDPVTGKERKPGVIDLAEFALEDISISCYLQLHGEGAPSGMPCWSNVSGGADGGFIVPFEEAKLILERAGMDWDVQAAKVRKLKADTEAKLMRALDPWRWNNGKVDQDLVDRIEAASKPNPIKAGTAAVLGDKYPRSGAYIGEGVDELIARAIRYDGGSGSDRSLAYALALQFKGNRFFKPRLLMLGMELGDEALLDFFRFQALYGDYADDRREIVRLTPQHCPEFLRYGTQEQLEATLEMQLKEHGVA